jgi:hypothetical protein
VCVCGWVGGEGGYGAGKGNEHILGFGYIDMHYTTFSLVMTWNMYSICTLHINSSPIQPLVGLTHHRWVGGWVGREGMVRGKEMNTSWDLDTSTCITPHFTCDDIEYVFNR